MAGDGQRFGSKFKPFLKIFDKTFIELALEPFVKNKDQIEQVTFILQQKHNIEFKVVAAIQKLQLPFPTSTLVVEPTKNVIETISELFKWHQTINEVVFCDCDHWLNIDELFQEIDKNQYDCIIPGWSFKLEEIKKWSVASVDDKNEVIDIKEKDYPLKGNKLFGVIGCYYFKKLIKEDLNIDNFKNVSEIIKSITEHGQKVKLIPVKEAEFFGDPERLTNLYISKNSNTIFCDLDGTIIKHENIPDYTKGFELLEGSLEKVNEWRKNNSFIVLTTSRDEQFRSEMEKMLKDANITYEYLVMGLPPGPRYLINDKKPYSDKKMADSFEVIRDVGVKNLNIGHSEAKCEELKNATHKSIPSTASDYQKVKFKAQYDSMSEINSLFPGTTPQILSFGYSMEFLRDYKGLHQLDFKDRLHTLDKLFELMEKMYAQKTRVTDWLANHLVEKITPKVKITKELGFEKEIIEIKELVNNIAKSEFIAPQFLCKYYHGDLTYENILVKNEDIKLIDFDNDNKPGPVELDLGKLTQSILTHYEFWDKNLEVYTNYEFNKIIEFYNTLIGDKQQTINKAHFYCALHLIRMIPYQAKTSLERVKKALLHSKKLLEDIK